MTSMILAAGKGTRLAPLTDTVPKALVEVGGVTMLERTARRLIEVGSTRLVVNTHHLGEQVRSFIAMKDRFGVETLVSEEPEEILDTGGGLLNAARFIGRDAPFFLHNVDVLTDVALRPMYDYALGSDALAVLAVRENPTERYLMFDDAGLCGFGNAATDSVTMVREHVGAGVRRGFTGIHVVSPRIFDLVTESGAFSIIALYARLAAAGHSILPYPVDDATWIDIGTPERLAAANRSL